VVLPEERRLQIVEQVSARPLVRADELAERFGVSIETVRRDLDVLQRQGVVRRVYGGVTGLAPRTREPSFEQRAGLHTDRKTAIGRLAATLISTTDTLILDVGTTVAELARQLPADFRGAVLTNSLLVATHVQREGVEVRVSGGRVRAGDLACSGLPTQEFFAGYFVDKAFLGSGGVHAEAGLTDYYPDEVAARQVMLDHAAERYVLADSSKLGQVAMCKVSDLDRITAVITDDGVTPDVARRLRAEGVRLLVAGTE
jgi:DeoR family transcriptional regulator, fructose operon transcriptional repressor